MAIVNEVDAPSNGSGHPDILTIPAPRMHSEANSPFVTSTTDKGPSPATPSPEIANALLHRLRPDEHGKGGRLRPGADGRDGWAEAQCLMPDPTKVGFVLASGNAVKVWMALFIHATAHGEPVYPDRLVRQRRPKPSKNSKSPTANKPKRPRSPRPRTTTKPPSRKRKGMPEVIGLHAEWDNGSLSRATNLKSTAVHAAQGELIALGWLTKRPSRNEQGQFGGFKYILNQPPTELTDAAKKYYAKKKDTAFAKAYEWENLLSSAEVEVVNGQCFSHAELFAYAANRLDAGRALVIEEHIRGCEACNTRLAAVKHSERDWGE